MTKLLLVEDDASLGETLKERLVREGYSVTWATTKTDAEAKLQSEVYDLMILDVGLPDGSGFDLARDSRTSRPTPIVFMTAMNTAENRLEGYEIGAEEFIPKPFHLKELLLRIKHVLGTHGTVTRIACGNVVVDFQSRAVIRADGAREFLPSRDFRLLRFLVTSAPRVLSRDEILNEVWGEDRFPSTRTVDNAIVRLRQTLGDVGGSWIRSVRGVGYQWAPEGEG